MVNRWLGGVVVVLLAGGLPPTSLAQSYPDCPPPGIDEYLLFVRGDDQTERDRTLSILPVDTPTLVCNYLGDTVVRAGGFNSLEVANSWALYLNDIEQLNTVVVEPTAAADAPLPETVAVVEPEETSEPQPAQPAPRPQVEAPDPEAEDSSQSANYQPVLLGNGVAVLVDYQQDPDIGRQLAQQGNVGLAVYLRQPYLLVLHTADASAAAARLQQLVDGGFTSFLVDSENVIQLTDTIR